MLWLSGSLLYDIANVRTDEISLTSKFCACQMGEAWSVLRLPLHTVKSWMGSTTNNLALAGLELGLWNFLATSSQVWPEIHVLTLCLSVHTSAGIMGEKVSLCRQLGNAILDSLHVCNVARDQMGHCAGTWS